MSVSESDLRHVAALARVELDPARLPLLVAELNGILQHMDALQRVDVPTGAEGEATVPMTLADDVIGSVPLARSREEAAPAMRDGFFLVPRLASHAASGGDPSLNSDGSEAP